NSFLGRSSMKIIIFGTGDLSKQLYYYIKKEQEYQVKYFCVNKEYFIDSEFMGEKVITFEECIKELSPTEYKFIIGVGYKKMRMRKKIFNLIKAAGFELINYVSPYAIVHGQIQGEGNIILSNVIVEPYTIINDNNIIWSNSTICHDVVIGKHNFIAANSVVGGFSKVGENNFIGFNSTIKDNIVIDNEVLIGANSLVVKSPENFSLYYGSPARKISEHYENGIEI
ncbi:acetyltransferase, partial [Neobacillus sp. NPDC097160]|uniref:acetyltransferase n=1 Tax=Neobacillus sp. NPDC097160 TaxID=3364298 RepID=UPI003810B355